MREDKLHSALDDAPADAAYRRREDEGTPDDELTWLFSAMDEVRATDELKARTLDAIFAAQDEAPQDEAPQDVPKATPVSAARPARTSRPRRPARSGRQMAHALRIPLVAACLVLALGGVAYALPASTATVTQDETTIVLDLNVFGRTIAAKAGDDEGQELVDEAGVVGHGYQESLEMICTSLERRGGSAPIDVKVEAHSEARRERLEAEGSEIAARHTPDEEPRQDEPTEAGRPAATDARQPSVTQTRQEEPAQGDQAAPQAGKAQRPDEPSEQGARDAGQPSGGGEQPSGEEPGATLREEGAPEDALGSGRGPQGADPAPGGQP